MESSFSDRLGLRTLRMTVEELRQVLEVFMSAKNAPLGVAWRLVVDLPKGRELTVGEQDADIEVRQ